MRSSVLALAGAAVFTCVAATPSVAAPAKRAASTSGGFVVRLGADTVSVERWTRTANKLVVDQVGRSPRVMQRHFEYDLGPDGMPTRFSMRVTSAAAGAGSPPTQEITGAFVGDSVITDIRTPSATRNLRTALRAGSTVLFLSSPWTMYEGLTRRLAASKADTVRTDFWVVSSTVNGWLRTTRLGRDSVRLEDDRDTRFHLHVDRTGAVRHVRPVSGTGKYTVDRATPDLAAFTAQWLAAEKASGAMGALSVRDTVTAQAGGASVWLDYGRPAKRGRVVFPDVVPFGELWRTGANAATQFSTDKPLDFGGVVVAPGKYTLWTIPGKSGWTLVFNSETGQWGTAHDPAKDVCRVPMNVEPLGDVVEQFTIAVMPRATGGVLQLDWDTTRAWVEFAAK